MPIGMSKFAISCAMLLLNLRKNHKILDIFHYVIVIELSQTCYVG